MRLIDANALISDLEHDVERDMAVLDTLTLGRVSRESTQFDKDWKQNTIDLLMRAPTIEPETNWISCKERLPESFQEVLVCGDNGDMDVIIGFTVDGIDDRWIWQMSPKLLFVKKIVAWQPLPEKFKEEGGEE